MGAKFKEFIIGKSPSSDHQIKGDKTVSRTHAKIFVNEENEVFITDLDSTNGTFINGKKLKKGSGQKLAGYEIVKVGNSTVNWRDIIQNDGLLESKLLDSQLLNKTSISKKSNKTLYVLVIIFSLVILLAVVAYFLANDKNKIIGEWQSFQNDMVSYTFYKDGTFSYDSISNIKNGDWQIYKTGATQLIELKFNDEDVPIFINTLKSLSKSSSRNTDVSRGEDIKYGQYGNLFNLENKSSKPIKLFAFSPIGIKSRNQKTTRVYITDDNYRNVVKRMNLFNTTSDGTVFKKNGKEVWRRIADGKVKNREFLDLNQTIVINPGESYGFLILTKDRVEYYPSSSKRYSTSTYVEDDYLDLSSGQAAFHRYDWSKNEIWVQKKDRGSDNWLGMVKYGILENTFEWNFEFYTDSDILELNNNQYRKID